MSGRIDIEFGESVAVVRIDNPERANALSGSMMRALADGIREAAGRAAGVVLTGSEGVFCAGADLTEFRGSDDDLRIEEGLAVAADAIHSAPVPVVAAIEGACVGAGFELSAACDVRVAGRSAFFEIPATRLGILYRPDGLRRLVGEAGRQTVARLLLLNERMTAPDAYAAGYVAHLTEAGRALPDAVSLANRASGLVPDAVSSTKALLGEIITAEASGVDWEATRRRLLAARPLRSAD